MFTGRSITLLLSAVSFVTIAPVVSDTRIETRLAERAGQQLLPHSLSAYADTYENRELGRMTWRVVDGRVGGLRYLNRRFTRIAREADISAVRSVAQDYLDGLLHADTALLARVFHPGTRFFGAPGGALDEWTVEDWIASRAEKRLDPATYTHRVVSVDVAGDAASAKVVLEWPATRFVDYLSLLRIDGEWKIVAKIWHQEPSARIMAGVEMRALTSADAEPFLGTYATDVSRFEVMVKGAELHVLVGKREWRLFYQGDGEFAPEWDPRDRLRFVIEGDRSHAIVVRQGSVTYTARRIPDAAGVR